MYNKTTWSTGDIVTAEKLNNIENGIVDADQILVIPIMTAQSGFVLKDITYDDILSAIQNGRILIMSLMGMIFTASITAVPVYDAEHGMSQPIINGNHIGIDNALGSATPTLEYTNIMIYPNNSVSFTSTMYTGLTEVTDNN